MGLFFLEIDAGEWELLTIASDIGLARDHHPSVFLYELCPPCQAKESVLLAVDGSALIYHVMQNPGEHELHLDLG